MANNKFIHLPKKVDFGVIYSYVKYINKVNFSDELIVSFSKKNKEHDYDILTITTPYNKNAEPPFPFYFEKDRRTVTIPHKVSYGFQWWLHEFLSDSLAALLKAKVSDEGTGIKRWIPFFHIKYPDFKSWVMRDFNLFGKNFFSKSLRKIFLNKLHKKELKYISLNLRKKMED
jgi:hypothetical protein